MAKIKQKTRKAAAKRFKITATGKLKAKRAGLRHNLGQKKRQNKRAKRKVLNVFLGDMHRLIRAFPYGL